MRWETWLLFAEVDPTPFPWGIVITALGTAAVGIFGAAATAWGIYVTARNNRLARQIEVQATRDAEQIKAGTAKDANVVALQTQEDKHLETMLDKALTRLAFVEAALSAKDVKCEEDKEKLRNECRECWKARAVDSEKLIRLEARLEWTEKKGIKASEDRHKAEEAIKERQAVTESKIEAVQTKIEAVQAPPPLAVDTLNVEAKTANIHSEETK